MWRLGLGYGTFARFRGADGATPGGARAAARAAGRHVGPRAGGVGGGAGVPDPHGRDPACAGRDRGAAQRAGRAPRHRVRSRARTCASYGAAVPGDGAPDGRGEGHLRGLAGDPGGLGRSDAPARIAKVSGRYFELDRPPRRTGRAETRASRPRSSSAGAGVGRRRSRAAGGARSRRRPLRRGGGTLAHGGLDRNGRRDRVPAALLLDRAALLGAGAPAQPRRRDDRRAHRPRQPPQAVRRHGTDLATADAASLAVGMFDLDGFKAYNDTFGHPAGDALLARLGARLAAAVGDRAPPTASAATSSSSSRPPAEGEHRAGRARPRSAERGAGFAIGCSHGSSRIMAGSHARAGAARRRSAPLRQQALRGREPGTRRSTCSCRCSRSRTRPS